MERRRAFRELRNHQQQEESTLVLDDSNLVNRAKVALAVDDPVTALHCWQEALVRYPRFAKESHNSLDILLGLRRFDEAEALMQEGQKRWSRDPYYAEGYALVAERRGNTEEAIRRWNRVRKKFPGCWMGYVHGAICLRQTGRFEMAEELSKKSVRRFPSIEHTWAASARIAEDRRDWPEAIHRWEILCEKFGHVAGDVGVARGLAELGRIEEAEQRLKEVQGRRPLVHDVAIALARLADKRGDKEEAVLRWADTRRRFPLLPFGYQEGFRHLLAMDRYAEAETILLAAIDRFPTEAWPSVEYASLAHTRQDWTASAARWANVRERWPDRQDSYLRGAEALSALGQQNEAARLKTEHQHLVAH
jgi:tetratricopeptide (TPR) repeat protein